MKAKNADAAVVTGPVPLLLGRAVREKAMPNDVGGIDRRTFVANGTMAAVIAVLAGGCMGPTSPKVSLVVQLSNFPSLANVGGIARVDGGSGSPVAAVRTGSASFAAYSLICPHYGCTVGVAGTYFQCPCHGATFDASGQWIGGQPANNLTSLNVTYDAAAGTLTIKS